MNAETGAMVAVLATSAGAELSRTIDAFTAVTKRVVVVDPLERVREGGSARVGADGASALLGDEPVLVVVEGETPTPELARALGAPTMPATGTARVVVRHIGRGWAIEPRGGAPRYGPWGLERFGFGGTVPTSARKAPAVLPGALVVAYGDAGAALVRLDAAAAALAALLDAAHASVGIGAAARTALGTGVRALFGHAPRRIGWGRWIGAVLLAYADVLTCTKVLERRGRP